MSGNLSLTTYNRYTKDRWTNVDLKGESRSARWQKDGVSTKFAGKAAEEDAGSTHPAAIALPRRGQMENVQPKWKASPRSVKTSY